VIVSNGDNFKVDEDCSLDTKQYFVKQAFETEGKLQKQKQAQQSKRRRYMEHKGHEEKELLREAHLQQEQRDLDGFTEMSSKIVGAVPGEPYQYVDFKKMPKRL
jgi:hypothetical protein